MRDDFPLKIKENLAKRVGLRCSNPKCRQLTGGPQKDPTKAVNVGVASHITAASPGGPRYDADLTPEQRCAAENGIWLCQKCGKLIDTDVSRYTAEDLRQWKRSAEERSLRELEGRANTEQQTESEPADVTAARAAARSAIEATRELEEAAQSFYSLHTQYGVVRAARDNIADEKRISEKEKAAVRALGQDYDFPPDLAAIVKAEMENINIARVRLRMPSEETMALAVTHIREACERIRRAASLYAYRSTNPPSRPI